MKGTFKIVVVAVALATSAICFAPFRDLRSNVKLEPESSEATRAQQQSQFQGSQAPVVSAPVDTDTTSDVQMSTADQDGKSALNAAAEQDDQAETDRHAREALQAAERDLQASKRGSSTWIFGALFAILGVGGVFALKQYANKSLPDMPTTKSSKW